MMQLSQRVSVITGAGSGIGRALAIELANRGCHLALADVNLIGLQETVALLANAKVRVSQHLLDVTSREQVAALPAAVLALHGQVDIVINNAGVAVGGRFEQISETDFDWLMEINFHAVVRMTRAFLPHLQLRDAARIVNISSIYGIISPPGQSAYSASKFAVRGFSNALRHELAGGPVGVTVVHPGGVATGIAKNAKAPVGAPPDEVNRQRYRTERMLRLAPDKAAMSIVKGIAAERARIVVGLDAKIAAFIERLMPVNYWRWIGRGL